MKQNNTTCLIRIFLIILPVLVACTSNVKQNKSNTQKDSTKDNIISKGDEIAFVIADRYIIHGKLLKVYSENEKDLKSCYVFDTKSYYKARPYWIGGLLFCNERRSDCMSFFKYKIIIHDSIVNIINYSTLPIKKNWKDSLCPILKMSMKIKDDSLIILPTVFILQVNMEFLNQSSEVIKEYQIIKRKGIDSNFTKASGVEGVKYLWNFFMKLFISSFYNESCRKILLNLKNETPGFTSGALGEGYASWAMIYNIYAKQNSKPLMPTD